MSQQPITYPPAIAPYLLAYLTRVGYQHIMRVDQVRWQNKSSTAQRILSGDILVFGDLWPNQGREIKINSPLTITVAKGDYITIKASAIGTNDPPLFLSVLSKTEALEAAKLTQDHIESLVALFDKNYHVERSNHEKLSKKFDEINTANISQAAKIAFLETRISELTNELSASERERITYRSQHDQQKQRAELLLSNQTEARERHLADIKKIAALEDQVNNQKGELNKQATEIQELNSDLEKYTKLLNTSTTKKQLPNHQHISPIGMAGIWTELLQTHGYIVDTNNESAIKSYLLALFSSIARGSIVLLAGPVGVGKTKLVKVASDLLSGTEECAVVIPVRPAWIDSADLLGYFDPLNNTFRPTPFSSAIRVAANNPEHPFLLCLDELNLARLENYGADLLSILDYIRGSTGEPAKLQLYAEGIYSGLRDWLNFLTARGVVDSLSGEDQFRMQTIQTTLNEYPSQLAIPQNISLHGTLNVDGSTIDLSPKVIDRAYVIKFSAIALSKPRKTKTSPSINHLAPHTIRISDFHKEIAGFESNVANIQDNPELVRIGQLLQSGLGLPIGHRLAFEYRTHQAVAKIVGIQQADANGYFVLSRILPRIRFTKSNQTAEIMQELQNRLETYYSFDSGDGIASLIRQIRDPQVRVVRYLAC